MTKALRHRCRNPRCRMNLLAPVENLHQAFCTSGCYSSFYRSRCLVCEDPIRRKNDQQKFGSGHATCRAEYARFPHVYDYKPLQTSQGSLNQRVGGRSAHSAGLKSAHEADRPPFKCLRHWWWGDPVDGDLSLYDKDGLTLARLVLDDGRYHLRTPITRPRMAWADLREAKHRAESLALAAIPLASVDPKLAARIAKDNSTPNPMGPPLNRPWPAGDTSVIAGNFHRMECLRRHRSVSARSHEDVRRWPPARAVGAVGRGSRRLALDGRSESRSWPCGRVLLWP
jgi:hypothetical protein